MGFLLLRTLFHEKFNLDIRLFFGKSIIESLLVNGGDFMICQFERIQLFKGTLAVLLNLVLELHALSVKIIRRVLLPMCGYS